MRKFYSILYQFITLALDILEFTVSLSFKRPHFPSVSAAEIQLYVIKRRLVVIYIKELSETGNLH